MPETLFSRTTYHGNTYFLPVSKGATIMKQIKGRVEILKEQEK